MVMKMVNSKTLALSALAVAISAPLLSHAGVVNAPQQRIIGGVDAAKTAYPWMVSVKSKSDGGHFCGASLIDKQWVLTAAHCIEDERAEGIQVTIAEYDQKKADSGEQTLMVSAIYMHQDYNDDHDIALLKLATESDKTPVALADTNFMANLNVGTELTTIGWGLTKDGDNSSAATVLQQVKVPLYNQADCKTNYAKLNINITDNMVCAGLPAGGKDSCQGDSGGPLFVQSGGSMVQLGVTSFGEACAKAKFPGVYTRVAAYSDWIAKAKKGEVAAHKPDNQSGTDMPEEKEVLGLPSYVDLFVEKGQQSASDKLMLENPKDAKANLLVSEMTINGDGFTLKDNRCVNQAIEPGKSCSFSVNYQNQGNKSFAEGKLQLKTNHQTHKTVDVELFALNGDAFDEADEVTCSIFADLNVNDDKAELDAEMNCNNDGNDDDDFDANDNDDDLGGDNPGNSNGDDINGDNSGNNGSNDEGEKHQATVTFAGAFHPLMLLGLLALPFARRRQ